MVGCWVVTPNVAATVGGNVFGCIVIIIIIFGLVGGTVERNVGLSLWGIPDGTFDGLSLRDIDGE